MVDCKCSSVVLDLCWCVHRQQAEQVSAPKRDDSCCLLTEHQKACNVNKILKLQHSHVLKLSPQGGVSLLLKKFHLELCNAICLHRKGQRENFEVLGKAAYVLKPLFKLFLEITEKLGKDTTRFLIHVPQRLQHWNIIKHLLSFFSLPGLQLASKCPNIVIHCDNFALPQKFSVSTVQVGNFVSEECQNKKPPCTRHFGDGLQCDT